MLGLATHEPHFSVLREVVTFDRRTCRTCGREGHFAADCPVARGETVDGPDDGPRPPTPYQFLHLYPTKRKKQLNRIDNTKICIA
jgi:5'-3' exoribonuclease 2